MYMLRYKFREAADLQRGATDLQGGGGGGAMLPPPINAALEGIKNGVRLRIAKFSGIMFHI